MLNTTTSARTDICQQCGAKLTHLLTVHQLDDHDGPPSLAPYSCPSCGHAGTVAGQPGRRIVSVDTRPYLDWMGR